MAPDIDLDQPLNIVHHGLWMRLARHRYCNICQPASPLSASGRRGERMAVDTCIRGRHRGLQAGQFRVGQIGDQHRTRGVSDAELRPDLGNDRLRSDAAGPEHRELVTFDRHGIAVIGFR
jgi:hypothetical protein